VIALLLAGALTLQTPDLSCRVRDYHRTVIRSITRRAMFLRMIGYPDGKVPEGYAVDHILPLALGGCDVPSNEELLPIAEWKAKSLWERKPSGAWQDGTNARLLQWAIDGCAAGRTPKELCVGRLPK
jgi:hypothetical protein